MTVPAKLVVTDTEALEMDMSDEHSTREKPVTLTPEQVRDIWSDVKHLRDDMIMVRDFEDRLNSLLDKMEQAGMAEWLPTLEEVRGALR